MLRFVMRRFLTAIPTMFVIVTISFFLMRVAPGGQHGDRAGDREKTHRRPGDALC